jgi:hypothetical protein
MRSFALFFVALLSVSAVANADKICLKTTVNKKTFKVTNQTVVAANCPSGYTVIADTRSFTGATGSQGPAGILNLAACRNVVSNCSFGAGSNNCSASCTTAEFILQQSVVVAGACATTHSEVFTGYYTNGLGYAVTSYSAAVCSYTHSVDIMCCPVS